MASGLEIWNAQGQKTLDTNDRLMRILGQRVVSGTGSLTHNGLTTGEPFYFLSARGEGTYIISDTTISVSGNTLSWDIAGYRNGGSVNCLLIYGVY